MSDLLLSYTQLKNTGFKEPSHLLSSSVHPWTNTLQKLETQGWGLSPQGPEDEQDMRDGH